MTETNQNSRGLGEAGTSISSQEKEMWFAVSYCSSDAVCTDLQLQFLCVNGLLREDVSTYCREGARSFIPAMSLHDTTRIVFLQHSLLAIPFCYQTS